MSGICGIPRRGSLSLVGCWDWPVSSTEGSCDLWILMCMFGKICEYLGLYFYNTIWDYLYKHLYSQPVNPIIHLIRLTLHSHTHILPIADNLQYYYDVDNHRSIINGSFWKAPFDFVNFCFELISFDPLLRMSYRYDLLQIVHSLNEKSSV
jgi:hypothetical protein